MCNHIPQCATRSQHIARLYDDMSKVDDNNLSIGDLSRADYLWVIRLEEKELAKEKSFIGQG